MSTVKETLTEQLALKSMLKCLFRGAKSNEDRSWITDLTRFFSTPRTLLLFQPRA